MLFTNLLCGWSETAPSSDLGYYSNDQSGSVCQAEEVCSLGFNTVLTLTSGDMHEIKFRLQTGKGSLVSV